MAARWSVGMGVAVAFALCAAAQERSGCALSAPGSQSLPSASCLPCHAEHQGMGNHGVDVPYAGAREPDFRPAQEVARRGVRLPGGEVRCTTCHDGASPWKYRIALPRGVRPVRAVNPRDRSSYEQQPPLAQPGDEVAVKPLCLACHALD
jgi:hypothetical protein